MPSKKNHGESSFYESGIRTLPSLIPLTNIKRLAVRSLSMSSAFVAIRVVALSAGLIAVFLGTSVNMGFAQRSNIAVGQNDASTPAGQPIIISMTAKEVDEVYRWSTDNGVNPALKFFVNTDDIIRIQNPTDEKHELVIESKGIELASSGDIQPGSSGQLTFKPTLTGKIEYHCEYHPETMRGTIEVTHS